MVLSTPFFSVVLDAQQLAILSNRFAAFYPGGDVVGLHLLNLPVCLFPMLGHAVGANAALALIDFALHGIVEGAQVQELLVAGEDILVDAGFLLHFRILHQRRYLGFQGSGVQRLLAELVVNLAPGQAFHLLAVGGEDGLDPVDDAGVVEPQFVAVGISLVVGHILLDVAARDPFENKLQQALAVHLHPDVFVTQADAGTV